jgi:GNAT superfamily N-acetyltransferase
LRVRVAVVPWDDREAADLRRRQEAELAARYLENGEPGAPPSAADMAVFVLARDAEGVAVGCGGLRPLDLGPLEPEGAELKRMYVVPESRGTGVADVLLDALEEQAGQHGWRTLRLATGERQPDAIRFYARAGYAEIPPFGPYVGVPLVRCFERRLR